MRATAAATGGRACRIYLLAGGGLLAALAVQRLT